MSDESYEVNEELEYEYLSYNGYNRPALVMGVPLMVMLPLMFFAIFAGFIMITFFGLVGLIPPAMSLLSIIVIRALTENDPNALRVVAFKLKGTIIKIGKPVICIRGKE